MYIMTSASYISKFIDKIWNGLMFDVLFVRWTFFCWNFYTIDIINQSWSRYGY